MSLFLGLELFQKFGVEVPEIIPECSRDYMVVGSKGNLVFRFGLRLEAGTKLNNILLDVYMVQYAIIQHFDQKFQKTENFYLATIFKLKH